MLHNTRQRSQKRRYYVDVAIGRQTTVLLAGGCLLRQRRGVSGRFGRGGRDTGAEVKFSIKDEPQSGYFS